MQALERSSDNTHCVHKQAAFCTLTLLTLSRRIHFLPFSARRPVSSQTFSFFSMWKKTGIIWSFSPGVLLGSSVWALQYQHHVFEMSLNKKTGRGAAVSSSNYILQRASLTLTTNLACSPLWPAGKWCCSDGCLRNGGRIATAWCEDGRLLHSAPRLPLLAIRPLLLHLKSWCSLTPTAWTQKWTHLGKQLHGWLSFN